MQKQQKILPNPKNNQRNQTQIDQLRLILAQKMQNNKSRQMQLSLFEKLQIYDQIVGQLQLKRTDEKVLQIFQQIMQSHYKSQKIPIMDQNFDTKIKKQTKNYKFYQKPIFSSPPNTRKQPYDIQDPQLFSFSKTRKINSNNSNQKQSSSHLENNKQQKQYQKYKGKKTVHSDKPRHSNQVKYVKSQQNQNNRKVSQFNSELVAQTYRNIDTISSRNSKYNKYNNANQNQNNVNLSIHQLGRKLKLKLLQKNSKKLFELLKTNIIKRKKQFKMKTSKFIYQLKLMKKTMSSFKIWNKQTKQLVQDYKSGRNYAKMEEIFNQWYCYATRSQQQKIHEKKTRVKKLFLTKLLNFRKFIRNSQYHYQQQQEFNDQQLFPTKNTFSQYKLLLAQSLKNKTQRFLKCLTLNSLINQRYQRQQLTKRYDTLYKKNKKSNFKTFVKLLGLFKTVQQRKNQKRESMVRWRLNSLSFFKKLQNQWVFQKSYWNNQNKQFNQKTSILNPNYQKIVFIYEILDCVQHSLNRKGYNFLLNSLDNQLQNHPAYNQFYKKYKLLKYFKSMKNYFLGQMKQKENKVKYQIIGSRVIHEGLLGWYRSWLQNQVVNQNINNKYQELVLYLSHKRISNFFNSLQKYGNQSKKQHILRKKIINSRVNTTFMVLKTYLISKSYYRKAILASKLRKNISILQATFLEWKLYYTESVHTRLLTRSLQHQRLTNQFTNFINCLSKYSLPVKIYHKKLQNVKKSLFYNRSQIFLNLLKRNRQMSKHKSKNSKKQLLKKQEQLYQNINNFKIRNFISQLTQNWFQNKLNQQIQTKVSIQYQKRLIAKCFISLKTMVKVENQYKQKFNIISKKKEVRIKRKIMANFIDKLIIKLTLRRLITLAKKYWFNEFTQSLITNFYENLSEKSEF